MPGTAAIAAAAALMAFVAMWSLTTARGANRRLEALRRNCFVTNEKGHRVRYSTASTEAQAKAEGDG